MLRGSISFRSKTPRKALARGIVPPAVMRMYVLPSKQAFREPAAVVKGCGEGLPAPSCAT